MKKIGGIILVLTIFSILFNPTEQAVSAACSNISSYGAVSLSVPDLPDLKERLIWVRMQTLGGSAKVLLEVNGSDCLNVGKDIPSGIWTWQTSMNAGSPAGYSFSKISGNEIKIVGISDGVRVDKVLITSPECTPEEFGGNCSQNTELVQSSSDKIIPLTLDANQPLSGKIMLSPTPYDNRYELISLNYSVLGKILQESSQPELFDTTLLINGKHTVYITSSLEDGSEIKESVVIETKNPENAFTPFIRWAKINEKTVKAVGLAVGGTALLVLIIMLIRGWYGKRRYHKFKGF